MANVAGRGMQPTLVALRQRFAALLEQQGFESAIFRQLKILEAENGKCKCSIIIEKHHTNRSGFLHGGVTASLIDVATTIAIQTMPPFVPGVSTDLSISFTKPVKVDQQLLVTAEVLKQGSAMAFTTASVTLLEPAQTPASKGGGSLVAYGKHTKFIQREPGE